MDNTIRKDLTKEIKEQVKSAEFCFYCGKRTNPKNATIDHVVPVNQGGTNDLYNLVCACSDCNTIKGRNNITDTIHMLQDKLRWCGDEEKLRRIRLEYYISIFSLADKKWKERREKYRQDGA